MTDPIRHDQTERNGMFFVEREGRRVAELTYRMTGDTAVVDHTWVDPKLRGGALAPGLVQAVVDWARSEGLRISPVCSYVRIVMDRSPETYKDVRKA
jgi:predicted GNAT family acetyltransferase